MECGFESHQAQRYKMTNTFRGIPVKALKRAMFDLGYFTGYLWEQSEAELFRWIDSELTVGQRLILFGETQKQLESV